MNRVNATIFSVLGLLLSHSPASAQPAPAEAVPVDPAQPGEEGLEEPVAPEPAADQGPVGEPAEASVETSAELSVDAAQPGESVPWDLSVAPRLGLTIPTSRLSPFVGVGVELGYRPPISAPALAGHLLVVADISYTRPGRSASVSDPRVGGDAGFEIDESELKLGIGAAYRLFDDSARLSPWGGGSLIMQRLTSTETNDLAPGENTSSDTRFGAELAFGADYKLGPGYLLGEARIPFTDLHDLITGNSNAGNVNLSAGYRFIF